MQSVRERMIQRPLFNSGKRVTGHPFETQDLSYKLDTKCNNLTFISMQQSRMNKVTNEHKPYHQFIQKGKVSYELLSLRCDLW